MATISRRLHRLLGIILLLPLLGWAATGVVFFTKPGYQGAYEQLQPRLYPVQQGFATPPGASWQEVRLQRSILGDHLLVRAGSEYQHLDPRSLAPRPFPDEDQLRRLVGDAISGRERYGEISSIAGASVITSTGVEITVDWNRLILSQHGRDTRLIKGLYRLHYLQWTGIASLDRVLGIAGLALLAGLTLLGLRLCLRGDKESGLP